MRSSDAAVDVMPHEWRWVTIVSVALVVLAFAPVFLFAISSTRGQQGQFMGVINNHRDGATYLAKMLQGADGALLVRFQHTAEDHRPALIQVLYPLLGQVSQLSRVPTIPVFHAARVITSIAMYLALYYLAATIWMRMRTRRFFFLIVSLAAGLGWLFGGGTGDTRYPDLSIPEIFPFYSSAVNVHFPLAIGALAMLTSVLLRAFRAGEFSEPGLDNGGLLAGLLSLVLAFIYPQALVPFGAALAIYVAFHVYQERAYLMREQARQKVRNGPGLAIKRPTFRVTSRAMSWMLVVALPVLPLAVYYTAIVRFNPAIRAWNRQNVTDAPTPLIFALGLAIPLALALPAMYRAVRNFRDHGDQFMLIWLLAILVAVYLPTNFQRRFAVGLMIPLAYFATRGLEDFWFAHLGARWRYPAFAGALLLATVSPLLALFAPVSTAFDGQSQTSTGVFLERDYAIAFNWLARRSAADDVVLASPNVSVWLPAWAGTRVVYGHPFETLDARAKEQAVMAWYQDSVGANCRELLETQSVDYVIMGPQETALGRTGCTDDLRRVAQFGAVAVYDGSPA